MVIKAIVILSVAKNPRICFCLCICRCSWCCLLLFVIPQRSGGICFSASTVRQSIQRTCCCVCCCRCSCLCFCLCLALALILAVCNGVAVAAMSPSQRSTSLFLLLSTSRL